MTGTASETDPSRPKFRVVLSVDGLNPRYLGPYGNSWVPAPSLNSFAAEATVHDRFFAETTNAGQSLFSLMTGEHAECLENPLRQDPAGKVADSNLLLITDDSGMADSIPAGACQTFVVDRFGPDSEALSIGDFLDHALLKIAETIQDIDPDSWPLFWVHTKAFYEAWDAPGDLQQIFKDEDDPPPVEFLTVPNKILPDGIDPDERLVLIHGYAAALLGFDECFGKFRGAVENLYPNHYLALVGVRGFPLGEHGLVGEAIDCLYRENVHLPLIVGNSSRLPQRSGRLCSTSSFREIFDGACADGSGSDPQLGVDGVDPATDGDVCVVTKSRNGKRLQTAEWTLLIPNSNEPDVMLFSQPDDLLEVNDVSTLCPDVAGFLKDHLADALVRIRSGQKPRPMQSVLDQ